jgi:cytoskeletal protein RodZ
VSLFKKKPSEVKEQESQGAAKSRGSLIVLLILLGGFAYLYFFTSLIVPHETAPAKVPALSSEVKQSMPPKPAAQPANPAATDAKKPEEVKPAAAPAPVAEKPAAPPAPATAKPVTPAPPAPVAKAQPAAKPASPPSAPPAPPAPKKEAAAVKKEEPKPAQPVQKKEEAKSAKAPAHAAEKTAPKKKLQSYAIFAGEFPAGEEAAAVEAKLAKLGIKPVARQETKKSRSMNRLYYGVYTDYDVYSAELDKLKQSAKGAFGVEKDGKYYLYAGSLSSRERAEKEKKDLSAKGVALQIQTVALPLSTIRITAGHFATKSEADKAAAKMKGEGLIVKVVPKGR